MSRVGRPQKCRQTSQLTSRLYAFLFRCELFCAESLLSYEKKKVLHHKMYVRCHYCEEPIELFPLAGANAKQHKVLVTALS